MTEFLDIIYNKTKITSSNAKAEYLVESINPKDNTTSYFRHPIYSEFNTNVPNLNLLNFKWSKKDGSATIPVKSTNFLIFPQLVFLSPMTAQIKSTKGRSSNDGFFKR